MTIAGIICEYNPLHEGHVYHMNETRRRTGCDFIVCVMAGAFMQRGEPAFLDKFVRAECALRAGADAVLELPALYAVRPAELYARGGVDILRAVFFPLEAKRTIWTSSCRCPARCWTRAERFHGRCARVCARERRWRAPAGKRWRGRWAWSLNA